MRLNTLFSALVVLALLAFSSCTSKTQNTEKAGEKEGLDLLLEQVKDDPDNADLHYQIARSYHQKKNPNDAMLSIQKAIDLNPKHIPYYIYLSDLYMETGQIKNTMMTLQQASVIDDQNTEVMLKSAEIHFMFKKYPETFEFVNKVLELDPHNDKAFFLRGYVYKEKGDTARAITNYMEAINNNPEHFNAYMELGNLFSARKNPLAIEYYGNAMKLDSTRIEPYYSLGMFYQNSQMNTEAIAIYRLISDFAPEYAPASFNIGFIYLEHLFEPEQAANFFSQAILINPEYVDAYFNRGLCYESMGRSAEARADYQTALKLRTNYLLAIEGLNRLDQGSTEKRDYILKQRQNLKQ